MSSRNAILNRLRRAHQPFVAVPPISERRPMVPLDDTSQAGLEAHFARAAEGLGCIVQSFSDTTVAIDHLLALIDNDDAILAWDMEHIPLPGLAGALTQRGTRVAVDDPTLRIGITGADAGLASTGSLVLTGGAGKPRLASLLPPVHVAVLAADRLFSSLEAWLASQRVLGLERFQTMSSISIISGPSRTGDIANIPVRGVHGPGVVHVMLILSARDVPEGSTRADTP